MRFTSNQLRMLQESLAPPMPDLEAPPEMQAAQPPAAMLAVNKAAHARPESWLATPLIAVLALYCLGGSVLFLSAASSPEFSRQGLAIASGLLTPAVVLQSLACRSSAWARGLGAALALALAPALSIASQSRPEPGACLACLASLFFACCARDCSHILKFGVLALGAVVVACSASACLADRSLRPGFLAATAAACLGQAAASAGSVAHFDLICALRSR